MLIMTKNRPQLNVRIDDFTLDLVGKMMEKTELDKSKVVRSAIEYYANYVLGQEEVMNLRMYKFYEGK